MGGMHGIAVKPLHACIDGSHAPQIYLGQRCPALP
jgi:hypothetical protein